MEENLRIVLPFRKIKTKGTFTFLFFCFLIQNVFSQNPEDYEIARSIETEMMRRDEVDSRHIDVGSFEGIVTLTGVVDNILEKERANDIARSMWGVRAVINAIDVLPPELGDEVIKDEVLRALRSHPVLGEKGIMIDVFSGVVDLLGTVNSVQQKIMAEVSAKGVMGVIGAVNMIQVVYPDTVSDQEIADDIRFSLNYDISIDHTKLDVVVKDGEVFISGPVVSINKIPEIKRRANVHGVRSVDVSGLRVDPGFPERGVITEPLIITDEMIFLAVTDALLLDPRISFFTPLVDVRERVVFLGGVADNLLIKMYAEETAANVVGVWSVNNLIEVRPDLIQSDSAIMENVLSAFAFDPFLAGYDLLANVIHGSVQLSGTVDNYFQKAHAAEITARISGVTEVINGIIVKKPQHRRFNGLSPLESYFTPQWQKNDFQLYNDIADRIFWHPEIHQGDVNIEVIGGHVYLRGIVDTEDHKKMIEIKALEEGAITVTNKLDVRYRIPP